MRAVACHDWAATVAPPARYLMRRQRSVSARLRDDRFAPSLLPTANRRGRDGIGASRPMQPDPLAADHVGGTSSPLPGRLCDNPLRDNRRHEPALALRPELIASI